MEQYNILFLSHAEKVTTNRVGALAFEFPFNYEDEEVSFIYKVRVLVGKETYRVSINDDDIVFAVKKTDYLTKEINARIKYHLDGNI